MELTYSQIMKLTDALDEYIYTNRPDTEDLVDRKLATSRKTAEDFMSIYPVNPLKALILLVADHYRPTHVRLGAVSTMIQAYNLPAVTDFLYTLVKEQSDKAFKRMSRKLTTTEIEILTTATATV